MNGKDVEYPFTITRLNTVFDYTWEKSTHFDGEAHNFWEAVYVLSGEVEVVENEKIYILNAQKFILHAPMEFHRIRSFGGTAPHFFVLTFEHKGALPEILAGGCFSLNRTEAEEYEAIFHRARSWFLNDEQSPSDGALPAAYLTAFLLKVAKTHTPEERPAPEKQAEEYRRVARVMQQAVCENLTLPDIAARACVSVATMKSLFAAFSGTSPKRYYALLRMREAEKLLSAGSTVSEAAEALGFSSPNYFSLFFKRNAGFSPGKLKNK